MPAPQIDDPVQQLRDVLKLLSEGVERLASEWESSPTRAPVGSGKDRVGDTVSHAEYDAVKVILAACGSLESLVLDPCTRLSTLSMSYILARALHVAAEYNVAELLARGGHEGIRASDLAASTGIEEGKLCRSAKRENSVMWLIFAKRTRICRPHHADADLASCLSGGQGGLFCKQSCVSGSR